MFGGRRRSLPRPHIPASGLVISTGFAFLAASSRRGPRPSDMQRAGSKNVGATIELGCQIFRGDNPLRERALPLPSIKPRPGSRPWSMRARRLLSFSRFASRNTSKLQSAKERPSKNLPRVLKIISAFTHRTIALATPGARPRLRGRRGGCLEGWPLAANPRALRECCVLWLLVIRTLSGYLFC